MLTRLEIPGALDETVKIENAESAGGVTVLEDSWEACAWGEGLTPSVSKGLVLRGESAENMIDGFVEA